MSKTVNYLTADLLVKPAFVVHRDPPTLAVFLKGHPSNISGGTILWASGAVYDPSATAPNSWHETPAPTPKYTFWQKIWNFTRFHLTRK
jgi:hypothetical protein